MFGRREEDRKERELQHLGKEMREEGEHSFLVVFGIRGRRDLSLVWYYGMAMLTERKWEILPPTLFCSTKTN
ncbi:hypothetical protein TorRG33x02_005030 [Trema orientale]|uniref:Uncharacterized protein n=1 Tax=Trema orientale TaxID=63057 RepID=A0A2P5G2G4_TREOI|nr:hypothetical protein TorRG33x02_005030 [Trema orientale]